MPSLSLPPSPSLSLSLCECLVGNLTRSNGPGEAQWSWVDPALWVDCRGRLHVLANMGVAGSWGERPDAPSVAAHAYSADGGASWYSQCYGVGREGSGCAPWLAYNGTTVGVLWL